VKDAEGKVQVKNLTESNVKVVAAIGGFIGLLIGGLLFPVAGLPSFWLVVHSLENPWGMALIKSLSRISRNH